MAIDTIEWHWESVADEISEDEHRERAGAHIGYYMEWAYKKGFAPNNPETHDVDEYKKVVNSDINGMQFLIENCDSKFWEQDLNEQGLNFTLFAYDVFFHNLETIFGHKPYTKKYNHQDRQSVFTYLDKVYSDYLANPPSDSTKKKEQSFIQKLKNLFS